jgi:hypothetical protein
MGNGFFVMRHPSLLMTGRKEAEITVSAGIYAPLKKVAF